MQQSWSTVFIDYLEVSVWSTECVLTPHIHTYMRMRTQNTHMYTHTCTYICTQCRRQEGGERKVSWNEHCMLDHPTQCRTKEYTVPSHQVYTCTAQWQSVSTALVDYICAHWKWTCPTHITHTLYIHRTPTTQPKHPSILTCHRLRIYGVRSLLTVHLKLLYSGLGCPQMSFLDPPTSSSFPHA